jgi:hypothetical protein
MLPAMKSFPTTPLLNQRAQPALRPITRPQPPRTMRSTVLLSLLLCPDAGADAHQRHGQGVAHDRVR